MKIIIPMSGTGNRFKDAGYSTPKYLLEVFNYTIIEHILKLFPGEKDINLIMNINDYEDSKIIRKVKKITKNYNAKIFHIDNHKKGPAFAVLNSGLLNTDDEIFINYCDFSNLWDWKEVKKTIKKNNYDGLLPAYKGLHLHSIYGNNYAFIKNSNLKAISIQEKKPFTNTPINEYASTGGYYFSSGKLASHYLSKLLNSKYLINDEGYISSAFELMLQDDLEVGIYNIDHFFQWGTPEDFEEFNYSIDEIKTLKNSPINLKGINLVIPAAGNGSRFLTAGYNLPKILLKVENDSLINKVISRFINPKTVSILGRNEHKQELEKVTKKNTNLEIHFIDTLTSGQAESAYLLINKIKNNEPIFIQSSDSILGNLNVNSIKKIDYDLIVFTKNNYRRAYLNPESYGWVNSINSKVTKAFIKDNPDNLNFSMILGSFLFKNKDIYLKLYNSLLDMNYQDFHIDFMITEALKLKMQVFNLNIDDTIVLGTPLEYELFNYMLHISENIVRNEN